MNFFPSFHISYTINARFPISTYSHVNLQVHIAIRQWRSGHGNAQTLDAAQRKHQQLFCDHYKSLERPKAHFRLHLPRIYERLGYFDAFPAEAKHRLYKTFLADTHQGLWNEGSGKVSLHICGRMLLTTVQQLKDSPWTHRLASPIYSDDTVLLETGLKDCSISHAYHLGSQLLTTSMPILWRNGAGSVEFFVQHAGSVFLVYEELREEKSNVRFTKRFSFTGQKKARQIHQLNALSVPTWWLLENGIVLCLL